MFNSTLLLAASAWTIFIPFAIFAAATGLAWVLLDLFAGKKSRSEERLKFLSDPTSPRGDSVTGGSKTGDAMARMLESAAPALAKPFEPKKEKEIGRLKEKLLHAGFRSDAAPTLFLGIKVISAFVGLILGGGIVLMTQGFVQSSMIRMFLIAGIAFYLPEIILWFLGRRRKEAIFLGLPDALDLMVVCVEAGLGLDQALRKVAEEMKKSNPVMSEEFAICNMQLQMGRQRTEVLNELGKRSGVDDLKSLAQIIIQADKFGSSIAQALRVQSESMRVKRRQIAEEKAAKTAVQLIFPLVIFIFPGIFVVLVGPAAITMINEMLPAFQNR